MASDAYHLTSARQTLGSRTLELAYEQSCRETQSIFATEELRRRRLQQLLLEHERDQLHDELMGCDDQVKQLDVQTGELQQAFADNSSSLESAQADMKLKLREIETLKAQLNSLQGLTIDSTKILTEKLTLARELSSLRPEIDHLRSQVASGQELLAEKLSLQSQISTLQAELENQRRSTKRNALKESRSREEDAKVDSQIENLGAELLKERREREKTERELQNVSSGFERKMATLEARLESFRTKFKNTKEELRETQASLQKARDLDAGSADRDSMLNQRRTNTRKRRPARHDDDTTIGTPGDSPASKRTRKVAAAVGEKSTFSVTPFLNRAATISRDVPSSPGRPEKGQGPTNHLSGGLKGAEHGPRARSSEPSRDNGCDDSNLFEAAGQQGSSSSQVKRSMQGHGSQSAKPRTAQLQPRLEQVTEERNEQEDIDEVLEPPDEKSSMETSNIVQARKPKRRVLGNGLGRTLLDEDDADRRGEQHLEGSKGLPSSRGSRSTLLQHPGRHKMVGAFGAISPLKRDRRIVVQ